MGKSHEGERGEKKVSVSDGRKSEKSAPSSTSPAGTTKICSRTKNKKTKLLSLSESGALRTCRSLSLSFSLAQATAASMPHSIRMLSCSLSGTSGARGASAADGNSSSRPPSRSSRSSVVTTVARGGGSRFGPGGGGGGGGGEGGRLIIPGQQQAGGPSGGKLIIPGESFSFFFFDFFSLAKTLQRTPSLFFLLVLFRPSFPTLTRARPKFH